MRGIVTKLKIIINDGRIKEKPIRFSLSFLLTTIYLLPIKERTEDYYFLCPL
jgi:hypothetical protein